MFIIFSILLIVPLISSQEIRPIESFSNSVNTNDVNVTGLLFKEFIWSQCGSADTIKFSRLEVDPDPMKIPGSLSIGLDVLVKNNLTSPLPFTIKMKKKVSVWWIDIPCEHGFGSCAYPDFCAFWPYPKPCPQVYQENGIPCSCPFPAKRYNLPEMVVGNASLPFDDIPSWLEDGHYKIETHVNDPQGNQLFCIQINLGMKVSK